MDATFTTGKELQKNGSRFGHYHLMITDCILQRQRYRFKSIIGIIIRLWDQLWEERMFNYANEWEALNDVFRVE
jgi:hypothetical protein